LETRIFGFLGEERQEKKELWFGDLKSGGCEQICNFLLENFNISTNVKRYKSELFELRNKVDSQKEIINTDWSVTLNTDENMITLITCVTGQPEKRLCVQAKEV